MGKKVSHSNNRSPKVSNANLQSVRTNKGKKLVCTRCIRSGKVIKHVATRASVS
ncbi:MAG: 50S ribosomal protein L28 [Pseudomonadota bacterium]